jgi:hypothetical protein
MKLIQTSQALTDHFPDSGNMVTPPGGTDQFVGVNKMADGLPRANGASTHQPRATPWALYTSPDEKSAFLAVSSGFCWGKNIGQDCGPSPGTAITGGLRSFAAGSASFVAHYRPRLVYSLGLSLLSFVGRGISTRFRGVSTD